MALVVGRDTGRRGSDRRELEPCCLCLAGRGPLDLDVDVDGVERCHELVQLRPGVLVQLGVELDVERRPAARAGSGRRRVDEPGRRRPLRRPTLLPRRTRPTSRQTNSSTATASAAASLAQAQDAGLEPAPTSSRWSRARSAPTATAQAVQTRPTNVNVITAGVLDGLSQANTVEATAGATVDLAISQTASQVDR